jgi:WD40 repeat protein
VITGHERSVYSVAWAPAGESEGDRVGLLASTGGDGVVCVWDVRVCPVPAPRLSWN